MAISLPTQDEMSKTQQSPQYGQRLLPRALEDHAHNDPTRVYASYARSSELADGFRDVIMQNMADAVNFLSW